MIDITPIFVLLVLVLMYYCSGPTVEPYVDMSKVYPKTYKKGKEGYNTEDSPNGTSSREEIVEELRRRLGMISDHLSKVPLYLANKSYTYSKEEIYLCAFDKDKKPYDYNTLMYAVLHEYAHVLTDWGADKGERDEAHGKNFKLNFAKLLNKAEEVGVWSPYLGMPEDYKDVCGVNA